MRSVLSRVCEQGGVSSPRGPACLGCSGGSFSARQFLRRGPSCAIVGAVGAVVGAVHVDGGPDGIRFWGVRFWDLHTGYGEGDRSSPLASGFLVTSREKDADQSWNSRKGRKRCELPRC